MADAATYTPDPKMHDMNDAILMSLSAIALMANHPYDYWRHCLTLAGDPRVGDDSRAMFRESAARCEKVLRRTCELVDAVLNFIGDANNAVDAVDDYGMTDAAFAAMRRALDTGKADPCAPKGA